MSFFHRPTNPSSESSEDDTASDAGYSHNDAESLPNTGSAVEEVAQSNGASAASASDARSTVSMSDLQSEPTVDAGTSIDEYRNMILASLLEDYYRTRAADYFNKAHPGKNYTRQSPEVQPLAEQLFTRAGQALSSNGLLSSSSASSSLQSTRQQYLSGLDNLAAAGLTPGAELLNPMRDLVMQSSKLSLVSHNTSELQLTIQSPFQSHYQANFEERGLLGKGAFGKVFRCYNPLDQKTYAVKKIRLSSKLSREFSEGRHGEMEDILREVKALAKLDHVNVVRYHAAWIEQPHQPPVSVVNHVGSGSEGLFMEADGGSYKPGTGSHKPVGTVYYRPPVWKGDATVDDSESGAGLEDEKTDLFALGVVFVEMLWRCGTAMERVDMLKDLQKGILPSGLEKNLQAEGLEPTVVRDVLALAGAMVDPNPAQRWEGAQVKEAVEGLLGRLSQ
ncbi:hypothetical protein DL765_008217 [Monosporascus sp. GIB2]|nr:hypothetical protein DL765_008217 [Monosporascus sp. GIB2]